MASARTLLIKLVMGPRIQRVKGIIMTKVVKGIAKKLIVLGIIFFNHTCNFEAANTAMITGKTVEV
ncbi:hypothetical protein D3C73_1485370 [compost metagenome]